MNWWQGIFYDLIFNKNPNYISGSSYIYGPYLISDVKLSDNIDPFELCCYTNTNGKLSMLNKNYYNSASIEQAKEKLKSGVSITSVSLIGQPKHGSVKNKDFCMYTMFINKEEKRATVVFRNSDFLKKLPIDVYWIKNILFVDLGIEDYKLDLVFNSITMRVPFFYIYLNYLYKSNNNKEEALSVIKNCVNFKHIKFINDFKKWYSKPVSNYKSLERAYRRLQEQPYYNIIKQSFNKGESIESL